MSKRTRIGKVTWSDPAIAKAMGQVQNALDSIPDQKIIVTAPQQYTEPMYVAVDDDRPPLIMTLARVVDADAPTTPVAYGAVCWEYAGGTGGQVKIIDIASMATGASRYLFTWKVEW